MLKFPFRSAVRFSAAVGLTVAFSLTASAQQGGGGVGTGVDAVGGTGGTGLDPAAGTGTGTGTGDTGAFGVLDADTVFSGIDRGETVGSTGTTGTGFSVVEEAGGAGRAPTGGIGGFGAGGFGGLGNLFGLGGAGGNSNQSTRIPLRTRLRSAINVRSTPPAVVQSSVNMRLRTLPNQQQMRGVNVTMQGRTAVVSGVVATERDRRMSELLLRLQPGVGKIDNQVVVSPQ